MNGTGPSAREPEWLALKDGRYLLRPLRPEDAPTLRGFFYSHTPETVQLRYGHMLKDMTSQRACELTGVDQNRDLALGLFEVRDGLEILHAIGRYCHDPEGNCAEMAFVVRESKRRRGMAEALLKALLDTARKRRLDCLWAQVLAENTGMLALLRRHKAVRVRSDDPGTVRLRIDLKINRSRPDARRIKP